MNANRGQATLAVSLPGIMEQYLPAELRGRPKDFFTYGVSFLPLVAGTGQTQTFQVGTDATFLVVMVNAIARDPASASALAANPPITVQVESSGSGRLFSNQALDFAAFYGTGQLPGILPYPKVIEAGAQLSTRLTHLVAGGTDLNVRVAYHGVKIFP